MILALAMMIQTVTGNNTVALNMAGRSGANLAIGAIALATNIGMNLWLIPLMGINGAAVVWLVTIVVTQVITSAVLYRSVGLAPFGDSHNICDDHLGVMFWCTGCGHSLCRRAAHSSAL